MHTAGGTMSVALPAGVRLHSDVLEGHIDPGRVLDRNLDGVPDGYRAMHDRKSIKVMVKH
jgi:hypothetical protein